MTREAKIGMLTGLGVIVLIGALLSEYLEPSKGGPAEQNRMASLPIGASYRDTVMQPPMTPGMVRADAGQTSLASGGVDPVAAQLASLPPAYAADRGNGVAPSLGGSVPGQPVVQAPVTPINDGQALALAEHPSGQPPVIQVGDTQQVSAGSPTGVARFEAPGQAAMTGQQYVIAHGDTLGKIAEKFYHSSNRDEQQKIVAANPGTLKSTSTMLIAGRKLMIPDAAPHVATAVSVTRSVDARSAVVIRSPGQRVASLPGNGAKSLTRPDGAPNADSGKRAATIYVVASGDTLNKIAKRISPENYLAVAKQIASLNKIKDVRGLQVGMKLKLPDGK